MLAARLRCRQVGQNALRKDLAELNAPLVEAEDVPNDALREDLVLVERNKRTQSLRGQFITQKRVRRLVALKGLERDKVLGHTLTTAIIRRLAEGQGLRLGEEICHQLVVQVSNRIVRLAAPDEVARNKVRTLMNQLIETVLAVRSRLTPFNRTCDVLNGLAVLAHALAVRLHIHLLQIGRKARKVLVIGQHAIALGPITVRVENAEKSQDDRHILLKLRRPEVPIHLVVALEELRKIATANRNHQRKTNRGRERITTADPVPEPKHVLHIDTECRDLLLRRRDGDEVLGDGRLGTEFLHKPFTGRRGVGHRLLRGERLGRDDEERLCRTDAPQRLRKMRRVDIRDKEALQRPLRVGCQRDVGHDGAKVAPADANVHDVLDSFARIALPLAFANGIREIAHPVQDGPHIRHHILAVDENLRIGVAVAQCRVENGTVLGDVDLLTCEHALNLSLEIRRFRQFEQGLHRRFVHAVLRVIQIPAGRLNREGFRTLRILGEKFLNRLFAGCDHRIVKIRPLVVVHLCVFHYQTLSVSATTAAFRWCIIPKFQVSIEARPSKRKGHCQLVMFGQSYEKRQSVYFPP